METDGRQWKGGYHSVVAGSYSDLIIYPYDGNVSCNSMSTATVPYPSFASTSSITLIPRMPDVVCMAFVTAISWIVAASTCGFSAAGTIPRESGSACSVCRPAPYRPRLVLKKVVWKRGLSCVRRASHFPAPFDTMPYDHQDYEYVWQCAHGGDRSTNL